MKRNGAVGLQDSRTNVVHGNNVRKEVMDPIRSCKEGEFGIRWEIKASVAFHRLRLDVPHGGYGVGVPGNDLSALFINQDGIDDISVSL